jgi:hypothetical protein
VWHALPIPFFLIWSPALYSQRGTNPAAPHYAISASYLLPVTQIYSLVFFSDIFSLRTQGLTPTYCTIIHLNESYSNMVSLMHTACIRQYTEVSCFVKGIALSVVRVTCTLQRRLQYITLYTELRT